MSGETEAYVSGWTVDTLHAETETLLQERDRRIGSEFGHLDPARSAWTLLTLKEYLEHQIRECERLAREGDRQLTEIASERNNRYDERARNAETALTAGFAAQQAALANAFTSANQANNAAADAHKDVHSANATALQIATTEMKEKLLEMNNLRNQITGERATYVTRDVLDARLITVDTQVNQVVTALSPRIAALEASKQTSEGRGIGTERMWGYLVTVATLGIALGIFVHSLIRP